jgi:nicotinamidase-related amidase
MNPSTTALVLIEYQNDFISEGGALHGAVKGVMDSTGMLKNSVAAVEQARPIPFAPPVWTSCRGRRQ